MRNERTDYIHRRKSILEPLAKGIESLVTEILIDNGFNNFDRVSSRAKSVDSYTKKAAKVENGQRKYDDPINQIQDQVGVRIIVKYISDIPKTTDIISRHFHLMEQKQLIPESAWKFGYIGQHFLPYIPTDLIPDDVDENELPPCFELQLKTMFQHAWAEGNHDLGYKPEEGELSFEEQRQLAYVAAQAWGADEQLDQLFRKQQQAFE